MNYNSKEFWADGGCLMNGRENPHPYGSYSDGIEIERLDFKPIGLKTNNESEYATLLALLTMLPDNLAPRIYTDSKLLVEQLTLGWKVKAKNLKRLHEWTALELGRVKAMLLWVPREQIVEKLGH